MACVFCKEKLQFVDPELCINNYVTICKKCFQTHGEQKHEEATSEAIANH